MQAGKVCAAHPGERVDNVPHRFTLIGARSKVTRCAPPTAPATTPSLPCAEPALRLRTAGCNRRSPQWTRVPRGRSNVLGCMDRDHGLGRFWGLTAVQKDEKENSGTSSYFSNLCTFVRSTTNACRWQVAPAPSSQGHESSLFQCVHAVQATFPC